MIDFDLFVIGAGSGGVRAARMAAQMGARVGIAEEYRIGGTCVIRGCAPKKLLVYASHFSEEFEIAKSFGWQLDTAEFSWENLIKNKDREISRLSKIYSDNLDRAGVEIFKQRAVVESEKTVRLADGRVVRAQHILIATGSFSFKPDIEGVEHGITSNEAFDLPKLPKRIIVVGGGYIAVEFAGIFNGLGVQTTLAYRGKEILRGFDDEIRTLLHQELVKKNIDVRVRHNPIKLVKQNDHYQLICDNGEVVEADLVMFATGRNPYTKALGLEACGVQLRPNGAVEVDAYSKSKLPSLYAIGDVTDRVSLTPIAIREGAAFAQTVFGNQPTAVDHNLVPTAVFSQPQLGVIGMSEATAVEAHGVVDIYSSHFRPMKLTLGGGDEKTFMKLIVEPKSDKVLGVHLMGAEAGEMIQLLAIPLGMGATKAQFDAAIAVHPTAAEELVTMKAPTRQAKK